MVKVLVMGGTDFNGLALVQQLAKWDRATVKVLDRRPSEAPLPRAVRRLYADRTIAIQLREVLGPGVRRHPGRVRLCIRRRAAAGQNPAGPDRSLHLRQFDPSSTPRPTVLPIRESDPVDRSERRTRVPGARSSRSRRTCSSSTARTASRPPWCRASMYSVCVVGPNNLIADREQPIFDGVLLGRPVLIPGVGAPHSARWGMSTTARSQSHARVRSRRPSASARLTGRAYSSVAAYVDAFAGLLGVTPPGGIGPGPGHRRGCPGRGSRARLARACRGSASPATLRPPRSPARDPRAVDVHGLIQRLAPTSTIGTRAPSSRSTGCGRTSGSGPRTPSRPRWSSPRLVRRSKLKNRCD